MTPQDLLDHFKTKAAIARFFDVKPPSVQDWFDKGVVPYGRQCEAQLRTCGVLHISKKKAA